MSDYTYAGGSKAKPTKSNQAKKKARGNALGGGSQSYNKTQADPVQSNATKAKAPTAKLPQGVGSYFLKPGQKATKTPSNVPDYLKQTAATAASQSAQAALDAADPMNDPLYRALVSAASSNGGSFGGTQSFSGNLKDYIAKASAAIPGVSYASEENAVKKNAASGQKDIGSMYAALAAYTAGQKPVVAQQYADSAANLKTAHQDAADLGNSIYASLQGNMAQGAGSVADGAQGTAAVGQNAALDQNASHQSALADALALGEQSALVNNTSQGNAAQGWITNSGNAAQLAGTQAKSDLTKALTSQLAQYATLQAQADQQKAAQALQLGQSQFNSDRSYAEQQQAAAAAASNNQFDNLYKLYGLQQSQSSAAAQAQAAALAQQNTETSQGLKAQANQTSFINAFVQSQGRLPTSQELRAAGF